MCHETVSVLKLRDIAPLNKYSPFQTHINFIDRHSKTLQILPEHKIIQ